MDQNTTSTPALPAFPKVTREQIEAALTAAEEAYLLDLDFGGYEASGFEQTVADVSRALRDAEAFAPYEVYTVLDHEPGEGVCNGGQVLVKVPDGPTVAGWANEIKHLTNDRGATGMDGLVAIAEVIVGDATRAVAGLRQWVAEQPR